MDERKKGIFDNIVGQSSIMEEVFELTKKIIQSGTTTVLIQGETGTGKELIARAIHSGSSSGDKPFIEVNCTAIPENLLEEELFGYERGAFTDAKRRKKGLLELADGGTLFLDEIGYMSPNLQVKVLKVIEEKKFKRLGGTEDVEVKMRIVAATNRDLRKSLEDGSFREDLFYRLNVLSIVLPPLRERGEDVIVLAEHFMGEYCRQYNRTSRVLSPESKELLKEYKWPGNVRELKNAIERAVLLGDGETVLPADISVSIRSYTNLGASESREGKKLFLNIGAEGLSLREVEKRLIGEVLKLTKGNRSRAAKMLKVSRPRLLRKMRKYGLDSKPAPAT